MQKNHKLTNPEKKDLPTEENSHYNQEWYITCHLPNYVTFFTTTTGKSIDSRLA